MFLCLFRCYGRFPSEIMIYFQQNPRSCSPVLPESFQSFPYPPTMHYCFHLTQVFSIAYEFLSGKLSSFLLNFRLFRMKSSKLRRLDISKRKKKDITTKSQQKLLRKQERRRLSSDAMTKHECTWPPIRLLS